MSLQLLIPDAIHSICHHLSYMDIVNLICSCQYITTVLTQSFWKHRLSLAYNINDRFEQFDWRMLSMQLSWLQMDINNVCFVLYPSGATANICLRNRQNVFENNANFIVTTHSILAAIRNNMLEAVTFLFYLNNNVHGWLIRCSYHETNPDDECHCCEYDYFDIVFCKKNKQMLKILLKSITFDMLSFLRDYVHMDGATSKLLDICIADIDINCLWIDLPPITVKRFLRKQGAVDILPYLIRTHKVIPHYSKAMIELVRNSDDIYHAIIDYLALYSKGGNCIEDLIDVAVKMFRDCRNYLALPVIYICESDPSIRAYIRGIINHIDITLGNDLRRILDMPERDY